MKELVTKAVLSEQFEISSAATSTEEIGNPVNPTASRKLTEHGIDCSSRRARQLTNVNYDRYDMPIRMDQANLHNIHRICCGDYGGEMHLFLEYTDRPGHVSICGTPETSMRPSAMLKKDVKGC